MKKQQPPQKHVSWHIKYFIFIKAKLLQLTIYIIYSHINIIIINILKSRHKNHIWWHLCLINYI